MATGKDIAKLVAAGLVFAVIAYIIHTVGAFATMDYYTNPDYFPVWSKLMMPTAGPPPIEFTIASFAFNFITGMLFAAVYLTVQKVFEGENTLKEGTMFGLLAVILSAIPGALGMYLMVNLPAGLIMWWTLENSLIYIICGVITALIVKKI